MTQRFYVRPSDTIPITPTPSASWSKTTGFTRAVWGLTPGNTNTTPTVDSAGTGVNPNDVLGFQGIAGPFAPQTISGTWKSIFIAREFAAAQDSRAQLTVRCIALDGSTVLATLIAFDTGALASEFSASAATNYRFPKAYTTGGVSISAVLSVPFYLVAEWGGRVHSTDSVNNVRLSSRDTIADADASETEATAAARPWFELSSDLSFYTAMDDTGAGTDALAVNTVGIQADDTGAGTDALAVNTVGIQIDDTAVGADDLPQIALSGLADESGAGADAFSVTVQLPSFDETGAGVDAFSVSTTSTITGLDETGTGADGFSIEATTALSPGRLWIGRFVSGDPLYTMQDEIINQQQIDAAELRPNVIAVDGQEDSWTEYDGDDLVVRDTPIHAYFDVPELKSLGDVRQRAVSEEETARRANSPGGDIAWDVRYTRMDRVYWITEDGSKYETRLEGLQVEFDQGPQPFQHATVDTGLMVLCPPDEASAYLVRDLFERVTADGLGAADTGGTWVIS